MYTAKDMPSFKTRYNILEFILFKTKKHIKAKKLHLWHNCHTINNFTLERVKKKRLNTNRTKMPHF